MILDISSIHKILGAPHYLTQPMISCYGKQVLTHALFLEAGEIILDKGRAGSTRFIQPGLYFYNEFLSSKMVPYRIEVSSGSRIWILTKSELGLLTHCALPA